MSGAQYQSQPNQGVVVHAAQPAREAAPTEILRGQLARMGGDFKNALPDHIKPEKFQRVVMTVVQQQPDLLAADRKSLLGSCMKCAADGLVPDGREAALVIFNTKNKAGGWEKKVQYMPMLAGVQKRVRNSGEVSGIEAHVIYEHDAFVWRQGLAASIEHAPKFPGDRGKAIGAYAVAKFKDGSDPQFEVMDVAEIERVRAASKSKDSGPWVQWWPEMARKTVFRRLAKWLPMDADPEALLRRDDENAIEAGVTIEGTATAAASVPQVQRSKLDTLEDMSAPITDDAPTFEGEIIDSETGEVVPETGPDATYLIEQIEAAPDAAALEQLLNSPAVRAKVRKLSEAEGRQVEIATQAARHAFGGVTA